MTMTVPQISQDGALEIVESLRSGIPPKRYVSWYATGNEQFLRNVRTRHLESPSTSGKIRFVSGSWGSGKTHFLRLLREEAFDSGYLISTVELNVDETPFNKFEQVFFDIIRNITSPEMYQEGDLSRAAPFAEVLRRALFRAPAGDEEAVTHERYQEAREALFADNSIDIDFRRIVAQFWETFLAEGSDPATLENTRGRLLQWFAGEGTLSTYRPYGIQKIVKRENARLMLQSLSRFAAHISYTGLVILFDEAEMSFSVMRKSNLKQAHNNLLHLINSIDESGGLFLVYAATPDFFIDERHGITIYGALSQRIGRPEDRPPRSLDRIWNLDAVETSHDHYLVAAGKIREIYVMAYPEGRDGGISESDLREYVADLVRAHPEFSHVSAWRVVITGTIEVLDATTEGEPLRPAEQLHDDIMERLRGM
jgi:hypothetical protein